jgi:hypothetical protein
MRNNKLLWLDDIRNPFLMDWVLRYAPDYLGRRDDIVWVKTYEEFIDFIKINGLPNHICFDNDLGEVKEGKDCAKFVVEYCLDNDLPCPKWSVQSANTVARKYINDLMLNFLNR